MALNFVREGLLKEVLLAILSVYLVVFTISFYYEQGVDAVAQSIFLFFLFAIAPVITIGVFVHLIPGILAFLLILGVAILKTSGWVRLGLLISLFGAWEIYGGYCSASFT